MAHGIPQLTTPTNSLFGLIKGPPLSPWQEPAFGTRTHTNLLKSTNKYMTGFVMNANLQETTLNDLVFRNCNWLGMPSVPGGGGYWKWNGQFVCICCLQCSYYFVRNLYALKYGPIRTRSMEHRLVCLQWAKQSVAHCRRKRFLRRFATKQCRIWATSGFGIQDVGWFCWSYELCRLRLIGERQQQPLA